MKKLTLALFVMTLMSAPYAADLYTSGDFWAPCNSSGKDCRFNLQLNLDFTEDRISGKVITMYGVAACRWEDVPINGSITPQGEVHWRSNKNPVPGCGSLVFRGKKEGETMIGHFPKFQGKQVDLTLVKK